MKKNNPNNSLPVRKEAGGVIILILEVRKVKSRKTMDLNKSHRSRYPRDVSI